MTTLVIFDDDSLQPLAVRMMLERQPGLTVVGEPTTASRRTVWPLHSSPTQF
ncbi:DNA-binding NarL/FixJ family response regulator [Streptomyces sp. SAI-133]|uniref:hypothetical protein n=1 Tax=Streptomyces sp. SAI-218 TaxID=3377736 RepID=UPI00247E07E1|nr:DNA-binding NarL/FixJ family response regulator [Streptomyces sp. SAI-133]